MGDDFTRAGVAFRSAPRGRKYSREKVCAGNGDGAHLESRRHRDWREVWRASFSPSLIRESNSRKSTPEKEGIHFLLDDVGRGVRHRTRCGPLKIEPKHSIEVAPRSANQPGTDTMTAAHAIVSVSEREAIMPNDSHQRAAEFHDLAAHAHRVAAAHHQKEDHLTGHELSQQAMEHSAKAFKASQEALQKSAMFAKQKQGKSQSK